MSQIAIRKNQRLYHWRPSRSTPHAKAPLAELPDIVTAFRNGGVKSVTDFGCGLGRNIRALLHSFDKVVAVEDEANIKVLRRLFSRFSSERLALLTWEEYRDSGVRTDAALLCCVLHTIPRTSLRREVIEVVLRHLRRPGQIALVSPRNDPKYREHHVAGVPEYDGGIVRLHDSDSTFSYYRNFSADEVKRLLENVKCDGIVRVRSPRRSIFIGSIRKGC